MFAVVVGAGEQGILAVQWRVEKLSRFKPKLNFKLLQPAAFISSAIVVVFFISSVIWMRLADFYHTQFFSHGSEVTVYQLARLTFIPFLIWLNYAVGAAVARLLCGQAKHSLVMPYERYPLYFLIGAGVWHVGLFASGLAGLYTWFFAAIVSTVVMILSIPHMKFCIGELAENLKLHRINAKYAVDWLLVLAVLIAVCAFAVVRGIYPLGPHDYYDHYFPYLTDVIRHGSLAPNVEWEHFYVSKGLSEFFLGMLLTDPLAPALVTTGFVAMGAWIVYAFLRRATKGSKMALIGALAYIVFFIIGNDDLEKQHDLTAVLLLGFVWASAAAFIWPDEDKRLWTVALHSTAAAIVLITIELGFLVGIYISGFVLLFFILRDWDQARRGLKVGVTCVTAVLAIGTINYLYTGLPLDQGLLYFWNLTDPNKFVERNILNEVLGLRASLASIVGYEQPWSWRLVPLLLRYLRLDIWWPILAAAFPFFLLRLRSDRDCLAMLSKADGGAWGVLLWFTAAATVTALVGGRTQVELFVRIASFSYGPTLCMAMLLLHLGTVPIVRRQHGSILFFKIAIVGLILAWIAPIASAFERRPELSVAGIEKIFGNSMALLEGRFSLKEAYQNQQGWAGKFPWGGVYPGMEAAWRIVGPGVPIFSFNIHSYCMLPDCEVRMVFTHRLGKRWETPYLVYDFDAAQAERALSADGIDYFFISKELSLVSGMVVTPLFSPGEIAKHLAVRWTDGTSYLLTWPGPKTTPIDEKFLAWYTKRVNRDYHSEKQDGEWRKSLRASQRRLFRYVQQNIGRLRPEELIVPKYWRSSPP